MIDVNSLLQAPVEKSPEEHREEPTKKIEFGQELNDLRRRIVNNEEVSKDELRAAFVTLRDTFGKRLQQEADSKKPAKKAKKAPAKKVTTEDAQKLLDSLGF